MNRGWGQFFMTQRGQFRMAFDTHSLTGARFRPLVVFGRQAWLCPLPDDPATHPNAFTTSDIPDWRRRYQERTRARLC